jgi:signal transduction histidine kinase
MRDRMIGRRAVRSYTARCPEGHYGLCDMRERAELVGGKLGIWSARACGTEGEVDVPGACAYRRACALDGAGAAAGLAVAAQLE